MESTTEAAKAMDNNVTTSIATEKEGEEKVATSIAAAEAEKSTIGDDDKNS